MFELALAAFAVFYTYCRDVKLGRALIEKNNILSTQ